MRGFKNKICCFFALAALLLSGSRARAAEAFASAEPMCPPGSSFADYGGAAGCERHEDGKRIPAGRWITRDASSHVVQEMEYDDDGQAHGLLVRYYSDGAKREERPYRSGQLHGLRKLWDSAGQPSGEQCFIKGVRQPLVDCAGLE